MNSNPIARLRLTGLVEGLSFLLLLGVAMPLKYMAEMPEPVRYLGWVHGILFMAYCWYLMKATMAMDWPFSRYAKLMAAALFPFGPFLTHKQLVADEEAFLASGN